LAKYPVVVPDDREGRGAQTMVTVEDAEVLLPVMKGHELDRPREVPDIGFEIGDRAGMQCNGDVVGQT
jgi:hypothetical protein